MDRDKPRDAKNNKDTDAVEMLKKQHREVASLFKKYEGLGATATSSKQSIFDEIADALAMHATIEARLNGIDLIMIVPLLFTPRTRSADRHIPCSSATSASPDPRH